MDPVVNSIVREARGNAFLLEQLARYAATNDQAATTGISLGVMLQARLRNLPKGTRQFVDALAVAGRPINPEVAYQAAGLSGDELPLITSLRAAQFLRSGGSNHTVELYHDRIRETLASQLDQPTVIQIHRRLAHTLEARGIDDPEALSSITWERASSARGYTRVWRPRKRLVRAGVRSRCGLSDGPWNWRPQECGTHPI